MSCSAYILPARLREILVALSRALVDLPDDIAIADHDKKITETCQQILCRMHFLPRFGFKIAAYFFDALPVFFRHGTVRFIHLAPEPRRDYISRWLSAKGSLFHEILKALRGIVLIAVFSQDEIWQAMGYDPKTHVQARIARREILLKEQGRLRTNTPLEQYFQPSGKGVIVGSATATHKTEDELP